MKKLLFLFVLAVILAILPSCDEQKDDGILSKADTIAAVVKVVVTDPEIRLKIPDDVMARLAHLEDAYLLAREAYLSGTEEGQTIIGTIVQLSGTLVDLLDNISGIEKYETQINTARLALKALQVIL